MSVHFPSTVGTRVRFLLCITAREQCLCTCHCNSKKGQLEAEVTVLSVLGAHKADSVPECPQSSPFATLASSDPRLLVPESERLAVLSQNQDCKSETLLVKRKW